MEVSPRIDDPWSKDDPELLPDRPSKCILSAASSSIHEATRPPKKPIPPEIKIGSCTLSDAEMSLELLTTTLPMCFACDITRMACGTVPSP